MAGLTAVSVSRDQFAALILMRWQLFVNSLRTMRGKMELVSRTLIGILMALGCLGGAVGLAAGAWFFVSQGDAPWLALLLWPVFMFWQMFPIMATAFSESVDSSYLLRFPLNYPSYFLVSLTYGAFDPSSVLGGTWLLGIAIGIAIADPGLLPRAAVVLLFFGLFNLVLGRMVFAWVERWLAQRRTREILGILFILVVISFQLIGPAIERYQRRSKKSFQKIGREFSVAQRTLPPGLAAQIIANGSWANRNSSFWPILVLTAYGTLGVCLLDLRLRAQYKGESLSETAAVRSGEKREKDRLAWDLPWFSGPVAGVFEKELHYLLRSGITLFTLFMPPFMLLIFRFNGSRGEGFLTRAPNLAFPLGTAYALLVLTNLVYNNLGADAGGLQLFFASPVQFRQIILGKNLAHVTVLAIEVVLIWVGVNLIYARPSTAITLTTLAGILFAAPVNFTAGNMLSIYSPKKIDYSSLRRQRASQTTVLLSLGIQAVILILGVLALWLAHVYESPWLGVAILMALAAVATAVYFVVLNFASELALTRREMLIEELCRT